MTLNQTTETNNERPLPEKLVIYQISGFDRPRFVSDITSAVPQKSTCRITSVSFEADGVQVNGQLVVEVVDQQLLAHIERQLWSVRGLVSVKQTNEIQTRVDDTKSSLNPYARTFFLAWGILVLALVGLRANPSAGREAEILSPLKTQIQFERAHVMPAAFSHFINKIQPTEN